MESRWTILALAVILTAGVADGKIAALPAEEGRGTTESSWSDLKMMYKIYSECITKGADVMPCLKTKAVVAADRALRIDKIQLTDSITLVRAPSSGDPPQEKLLSEKELLANLPRSEDAREEKLDEMFLDRIYKFLKSRTLQFKLADLTESADSLSEARGKMKKIMPYLLMMKMMAGTGLMVAMGKLAMLAGKALLVSKLALALAAIIGLKKLFGGQEETSYQVVSYPSYSHGHSHSSSYEGGGGGGGGGGHYARSLQGSSSESDPQALAYRGHLPDKQVVDAKEDR